ncbi:MAG: hypothetical protein HS115_03665 [Spirochaetales bacterium]|nr:hypothetical protein [Spirochaetales bacterium]
MRHLALSLALLPALLWAQEETRLTPAGRTTGNRPALSEEEVKVPRVRFINRTNARASEAARAGDGALGRDLARETIEKNKASKNRVDIQRIFDEQQAGFGADVVDVNNAFGHINVLQRVLKGYLQEAFQYNEADADTLSQFVLYYNARNRGEAEKLKEKYSPAVMAAVSPQKVGIDRSYQNWAGRTQLLLPLRKSIVRPGRKDIENKELRKNSGPIDPAELKKMQEIEDRRRTEDKKLLEKKGEELKKEAAVVKKEQETLKKESGEVKKELADTGKKLQELRKDPEANKEEIAKAEKKEEELQKKEQEVAAASKEAAKKEEAIKSEQKEVAEAKKEIAKEEGRDLDKEKEAELAAMKKEKEELEKEKKEKEEKSENVMGDKILFLRVVRYIQGGHYQNELWWVDAAKDDALFRGPFSNICGRDFLVTDGGIVVSGYKGSAHNDTDHNLVLLDPKDLSVKAQSAEKIFWRSSLDFRDGKIYSIIQENGSYYLARHTPALALEAKSSAPISEDSKITFFQEKIYVTGKGTAANKDTTIQVFNKADLKQSRVIVPKPN